MLTSRTILSLLLPGRLSDLVTTLLLFGLLPLGEVILIVFVGSLAGTYLVLAVVTASMLAGGLGVLSQIRIEVTELRRKVTAGEPAGPELESIAALLLATFLILSPGLLSDLAAFVIMSPRVRRRLGAVVVRRVGIDPKQIHEYMKLSETETPPPAGGDSP